MALTSGGNLAGLARVSFEAQTGEFNADVKRAEATYRDATRGMSDESIRLELSQERLRRELAKGPANYRAIARAELEVRRSEQQLRMENERLERSFRDTGRTLDRAGRGALLGSGAFRGLARSISFASAGFLGGAGLVYGMRQAISAASNLEEQQNKVRVVFQDSSQETIQWSTTTATSIGIASDQALAYAGQIGAILNVTGLARAESARMSRQVVQLAADMASFNNEDPTEMLEAIRSGLVGEAEPLRRRGVLLDEATVKQEAYRIGLAKTGEELSQGEKVQARYSLILKQTTDQQGDYARTSDSLANSQRTLSALWREANILVGQALAPAFTDAVQGLRDWLSEERNQEQVQRTVNQLVGDGVTVVEALADVLGVAKDAAEPLVEAVGGIGNAVRILGAVWLASKAKALLSFGGIAASSSATTAKVVRDAAVAGRALDVAYRHRTMTVTTAVVGGGVPGGGKGPGRLARGLGMLGVTPGGAIVAAGAAAIYLGLRSGQKDAISSEEWQKLQQAARTGKISYDQIDELEQFIGRERAATLRGLLARFNAKGAATGSPDNSGEARGHGAIAAEQQARARRRRRRRENRARFNFGDFERGIVELEEDRLDAEATPGEADDLRVERRRLELARRALRELDLTREQRMKVKAERNRALQAIAAAEAEADQEAQAARDARAEKRAEAARKAEAAQAKEEAAEAAQMEKVMTRAQRHYERMAKLTKGIDFTTAGGLRKAALRGIDPKTGKPRRPAGQEDEDDPLTEAELRRMLFDFATGLHGVVDQFGSNVGDSPGDFGMAGAGTELQLQSLELRRQTRILEDFTGAVRHPMTGYHRTEGTTTLVGYGF